MRIRVAKLAELAPNKGAAVTVGDLALVLFRSGERVYALRNRCPHAGAPLSIGRLRGTELTCAWHGWMFDVTTGECLPKNPPFDVPSYPVAIQGEDVFVDLPESPTKC